MARDIVTTQAVPVVGLAPTMTAPVVANGDVCDPGGVLVVTNDSGGVLTVTIQTPSTVDGLAVAENVFTVPDAGVAVFRLKPPLYSRPAGGADPGKVYVDYDSETNVTRAVVGL